MTLLPTLQNQALQVAEVLAELPCPVATKGLLTFEESPRIDGAVGISQDELLYSDFRCAGEARLLWWHSGFPAKGWSSCPFPTEQRIQIPRYQLMAGGNCNTPTFSVSEETNPNQFPSL